MMNTNTPTSTEAEPPLPTEPGFTRTRAVLQRRLVRIVTGIGDDVFEITAIAFNFAWLLPLSLYENYFSTAGMDAFNRLFPREILLPVTTIMGAFVLIGLIAGGTPSEWIKTNSNALFWLRWRQVGLRASALLFFVIGILFSMNQVTVRGNLYIGFAFPLLCFGVIRFNMLIEKHREKQMQMREDVQLSRVLANLATQ